MKSKRPKIFISYKWQDNEHNRWVGRLYTDLRTRYGIDAMLDTYEVEFGESFSDYMVSKIDRECDAMLFVITTAAVRAVDESKSGGVHFEMQLANARRMRDKFKIIGVYREGNDNTAYLRDHRYVDFRDDNHYERNLEELAKSLLGYRRKPPLKGLPNEEDATLGITPEEWRELTNANPSLRGNLLGYAAEMKLRKMWFSSEHATSERRDDGKKKSNLVVTYRGRDFIVKLCSLRTSSIRRGVDKVNAVAQCDSSERRIVKVSGGSSLNTPCLLVSEFDLLAVNIFAINNEWRFLFAKSLDLPRSTHKYYTPLQRESLLASVVRVTYPPVHPFYVEPFRLLDEIIDGRGEANVVDT